MKNKFFCALLNAINTAIINNCRIFQAATNGINQEWTYDTHSAVQHKRVEEYTHIYTPEFDQPALLDVCVDLPDTDKDTQTAHSWNPDDQSQNIRNITADYIVIKPDTDETHINFENRWNFNWCEQRPVDSALQWEVSDQKKTCSLFIEIRLSTPVYWFGQYFAMKKYYFLKTKYAPHQYSYVFYQ